MTKTEATLFNRHLSEVKRLVQNTEMRLRLSLEKDSELPFRKQNRVIAQAELERALKLIVTLNRSAIAELETKE